MSREEIESMLASIGVSPFAKRPLNWKHAMVMFTKFAALVAAKEREAVRELLTKAREIAEWHVSDGDECGILARSVMADIDALSARGGKQ